MKRALATLVVLMAARVGLGEQGNINWLTDPKQAVAQAKRTGRPLMVYGMAASKDRDDDTERYQRRALRDPQVLRLAAEFVPLRLSRSVHRAVLGDFHLPWSGNMMMSFVAPDGTLLGTLGAGGVAQPKSLASKLRLVLKTYRAKLYKEQVEPVLKDENAKTADIKTALEKLQVLRVTSADKIVIELLERHTLATATRQALLDTLARLSTRGAVTRLLEFEATDKQVAQALTKCTPAGAEMMLEVLRADKEPFDYDLYSAITRICAIRKTKTQRWFEKAKLRMKEQEVERVANLVRGAARRWKELNDEPR